MLLALCGICSVHHRSLSLAVEPVNIIYVLKLCAACISVCGLEENVCLCTFLCPHMSPLVQCGQKNINIACA